MHAGFMVGIALLLVATACEFATWLGRGEQAYAKRAKTLAVITLLTLGCSAINPDGFSHWLYPFQVMSMDASTQIQEWLSPNFHSLLSKLFLFLVMLFFVLNIYRRGKPDLGEILIPSIFIAAAFISRRHMPIAILTMIPYAAIALAGGAAQAFSASRLVRLYNSYTSTSRQLGQKENLLNLGLLLVVLIAALLLQPVYQAKAEAKRNAVIPVGAADFIVSSGLTGKMFNEYHFGGYLIYRLYPQQKVYIDGRADMYGDTFFNQYMDIYRGARNWQTLFDRYPIDYVVCSNNAPIRQLLLARGDFTMVYMDTNNSVLVKNIPRYAAIIAHYAHPLAGPRQNSSDKVDNQPS
jgi:hypothetical protein